MAKPKPCMEPGCERPKWAPLHRCYWHALLAMPIDEQIGYADKREEKAKAAAAWEYRARVAAKAWPEGTRWCSGCQWFVPDFYTQGSRCKACGSKAAYSSHLKATYDITYDDYKAMYDWQGGRCYICRKAPKKKRLAVDHDHLTGEVRGLLCADSDRGCNHAILGNITSLDMARRIVSYLENPPLKMVRAGRDAPEAVVKASPIVQGRIRTADEKAPIPGGPWSDGVEVGTMDVMAALGAGQGLNAAGDPVAKGSELDVLRPDHPFYEGIRAPFDLDQSPIVPWPAVDEAKTAPAPGPVRPQEPLEDLDAQWDALVL
jgi:hypothetical protein